MKLATLLFVVLSCLRVGAETNPKATEFISSATDLIHVLESPTVRDELKDSGQVMQIRLINNGFHMGYQLITEKCQMDVMVVKSIEDRNNQIVALPKECRHQPMKK